MKKSAILLAAVLALSACETVKETARDASDKVLDTSIFALCGTPYSAAVRNKRKYVGLTPSLKALCGDL